MLPVCRARLFCHFARKNVNFAEFVHKYLIDLIRLIIIFFLVYFLISLFSRYVLPFALRFFFRRMSSRVRKDYERQMQEKRKKEREGEVTIRYKPGSKKRITPDDGDYVDYEEVDDD